MAKLIRNSRKVNKHMSLSEVRDVVREQFQLVLMDEERAVRALPKLIRPGEPESDAALDALRELLVAPGSLAKEEKTRVARAEKTLGAPLLET